MRICGICHEKTNNEFCSDCEERKHRMRLKITKKLVAKAES